MKNIFLFGLILIACESRVPPPNVMENRARLWAQERELKVKKLICSAGDPDLGTFTCDLTLENGSFVHVWCGAKCDGI